MYHEEGGRLFIIVHWREKSHVPYPTPKQRKFIPDSTLKAEAVHPWLYCEDRHYIRDSIPETRGSIFLVLHWRQMQFIPDCTVRQALCLWLHSADRGTMFLILLWRRMLLIVPSQYRKHIPDITLQIKTVCSQFCTEDTSSMFPFLSLKTEMIPGRW